VVMTIWCPSPARFGCDGHSALGAIGKAICAYGLERIASDLPRNAEIASYRSTYSSVRRALRKLSDDYPPPLRLRTGL
jgi:hypothetical protein